MNITKNSIGKIADVSVYDDLSGVAEVKDVSGDVVTLQWIFAISCYPTQVFSEEVYTEDCTYNLSEIADYDNERDMDSSEIQNWREASIMEDKLIFERFNRLAAS